MTINNPLPSKFVQILQVGDVADDLEGPMDGLNMSAKPLQGALRLGMVSTCLSKARDSHHMSHHNTVR